MSSYMSNMMISVGLMVVVQSAVNSYFGFETPATCAPGVNDNSWVAEYKSVRLFHPQSVDRVSHFIELEDGVQLAVDVYTSEQAEYHGMKVPTILHLTRHGRGYTLDFPFNKVSARGDFINPRTGAYIGKFVTEGYAWVAVDIRGTGASFGTKSMDFADQEATDAHHVIDWITKQSWSNGDVSAFGVGLDGVSALVLAANPHPALKAVALNGVPAELFDAALVPGGVRNDHGTKMYSSFCKATDSNERWNEIPHLKSRLMMKHFGGNVYPMNMSEPEVHAAAVAEHKGNPVLSDELQTITFRDDTFATTPYTFADFDARRLFEKLAASDVAVLHIAGYYDMGTSRSALQLHQYVTGQMDAATTAALGLAAAPAKPVVDSTKHRLILGPWSHANVDNLDPFAEAKTRCFEPIDEISRFLDHHAYPARRADAGIDTEQSIHYFTMGEEKWKTTTEWPPAIIDDTQTLFFSANETMVDDVNEAVDGETSIDVDPKAATVAGFVTRWNFMDHIFLNKPTYAHNRDGLEKKLVSFVSPKLHQRELTGEMTLTVYFSANKPLVHLFATLEDVNLVVPIDQRSVGNKVRGGVTYITEGVVNPVHTSVAPGSPLRTFLKADGRVLEPETVYEATFNFYPTSYLLPHDHQLRITLSGAESPSFVAADATKLTVHYGAQYPSALTIKSHEVALPVQVNIVQDKPTTQAPVEAEDEFANEKIEL